MQPKFFGGFGLLLLISSLEALATPEISEPFDSAEYPTGSPPMGQNGGTGFSGPFQTANTMVVPGLTLGSSPTSGNALRLDDNGQFGRYSSSIPSVGSDVWVSFMLQKAPTASGSDLTYLSLSGVNHDDVGSGFGTVWMWLEGTTAGTTQPSLRARHGFDDLPNANGNHTLAEGDTYLFVTKISNFNNASSGHPQELSLWALNGNDYNALSLSALSESSLDAHNSSKATMTSELPLFDGDTIQFFAYNGGESAIFDEFRVGFSLDSLGISPVPEPGEYGMVCVASLVIFAAVRRMKVRRAKTTVFA